MHTLYDLVSHLRAYVGNDASQQKSAAVRRACAAALRIITTQHDWQYYQTIGRVVTVAAQQSGTVEYDHAGGANERMLTLTGATWPDWIANGHVMMNNVTYDVAARISNAVVTLTEQTNPGADVAAGTAYTAYRSAYPMPADFRSADSLLIASGNTSMLHASARHFTINRTWNEGPSTPREYSFLGSRRRDGTIDVFFWPPPDQATSIDFLYKRTPRAAVIEDESAGKVTLTAASTTVTGHGTAFRAAMVGSVLRASATAEKPTSADDLSPPRYEGLVTAVASPTSLTIDTAPAETLTRAGYVISDPIDVEQGPMYDFLLQIARKELRIAARINLTNEELEAYEMAKRTAKTQDGARDKSQRVAQPKIAWPGGYPSGTGHW